jgi:hypothetical protein
MCTAIKMKGFPVNERGGVEIHDSVDYFFDLAYSVHSQAIYRPDCSFMNASVSWITSAGFKSSAK